MNHVLLLATCCLFVRAECAKILGVFPAPGRSQFILAEALMQEVAKRGHEVTVISPYRPKKEPSNYKTILIEELLNNDDSNSLDLFEIGTSNLFTNIKTTYIFGNLITETTLKNVEVQKLLVSKEKFDLVIIEQFFNDALKGFAAHFEAPLVLFSSMGATEWNKFHMGNPFLPSIHPVCYTSYTNNMDFPQRLKNLIGTIYDYLYRNLIFFPTQKQYLAKYFPNSLDFNTILYNASIMLLNSHVTTTGNVLLPYNMIEIGGFHINRNPLTHDVQNFLDSATNGAILFSLGSNLKSADLSQSKINAILKVFKILEPIKVLWKFETDLAEKPENVLISKWFKQSDILAHPNMKLFITHGGMLSTTEAIFYGVPMIGIPVFADQKMNIAKAKSLGIATEVPFLELSEETFASAINETLSNPNYKIKARKIAEIINDRPEKPLDLAMYWIEYVIRHQGMRFDAPSLHLYWFEIYMIDILCFGLLILWIGCYIVKKFKNRRVNVTRTKQKKQ